MSGCKVFSIAFLYLATNLLDAVLRIIGEMFPADIVLTSRNIEKGEG
jgi:hypothetical protein